MDPSIRKAFMNPIPIHSDEFEIADASDRVPSLTEQPIRQTNNTDTSSSSSSSNNESQLLLPDSTDSLSPSQPKKARRSTKKHSNHGFFLID